MPVCVAAVWALHPPGSLCSRFCREGSGSEGHGLGAKGDRLSYRVSARSKLQRAAGCLCESEGFWRKVPVVLGAFSCQTLSLRC